MRPPVTAETPEEDILEEESTEEKDEEGLWQPPALPILTWPMLQARTGLVYDQRMTGHHNLWDKYVVRGPPLKWSGRSLPRPQTLSPAPGSCPPTPATTQRCLSESYGSCSVWRSWALRGAASHCLRVLPPKPNSSPATGQTPLPGVGVVPQCKQATLGAGAPRALPPR